MIRQGHGKGLRISGIGGIADPNKSANSGDLKADRRYNRQNWHFMREVLPMTDPAVLAEIGQRLARHRLNRNLTQAELAKEAGVSKRTLVRLEGGESTQLTNLIRVLRALGLLANLDAFIPPPVPSPIQQLRTEGKRRKRASRKHGKPAVDDEWTWGESDDGQAGSGGPS
jgi:transcriptional regulator with XRE-family HTH domain